MARPSPEKFFTATYLFPLASKLKTDFHKGSEFKKNIKIQLEEENKELQYRKTDEAIPIDSC